jgi:hypothetical protein
MSKPLPSQNTFAGLAPPWSLVNLDSNFTNTWNAVDDWATYSLYVIDSGVVNALQVTITAPLTVSMSDGLSIDVKVANTTTSATPTLQINALGTVTIKNVDGSALNANQLVAGGIYRLIYSASANAWLLLGGSGLGVVTFGKGKPATTSRASTTTPSNDPDLTFSITLAGTYAFKGWIPWSSTANAGMNLNVNYSGTFTAGGSYLGVSNLSTVGPFTGSLVQVTAAPSTSLVSASGTTGANVQGFTIQGSITATGAGTLAFAWAQNASSVTATNVIQGAYMIVTRVV